MSASGGSPGNWRGVARLTNAPFTAALAAVLAACSVGGGGAGQPGPPPAVLAVTPTMPCVAVGEGIQLAATADGQPTQDVLWSSSGGAALVDASGRVTGVASGTATVRASKGGASAGVDVTVTAFPLCGAWDFVQTLYWWNVPEVYDWTATIAPTATPGIFSVTTNSPALPGFELAASGDRLTATFGYLDETPLGMNTIVCECFAGTVSAGGVISARSDAYFAQALPCDFNQCGASARGAGYTGIRVGSGGGGGGGDTVTVGASGGTFTIGDVAVVVPPGAVEGTVILGATLEEGPPGPLPAGVVVAGRTVVLGKDRPGPFGAPVRITIPYDPATLEPDDLPGVFLWDEAAGRWRAATVKAIDPAARTITFTTWHFSQFTPLGVRGLARTLPPVDTGFRPNPHGFFHPNFGSFADAATGGGEAGSCFGMVNFAIWAYTTGMDPPLFQRYREGDDVLDPDRTWWEDDLVAREVIARAFDATSQEWAEAWLVEEDRLGARATGLLLLTAMRATGAPQAFNMVGWTPPGREAGGEAYGHSVAAYAYADGVFHVYETGAPGDSGKVIEWSPEAGTWSFRSPDYPGYTLFSSEGVTAAYTSGAYERIDDEAATGFSTPSEFVSFGSSYLAYADATTLTIAGYTFGGALVPRYVVWWVTEGRSLPAGEFPPDGAAEVAAGGDFTIVMPRPATGAGTLTLVATDDPSSPWKAYGGFVATYAVRASMQPQVIHGVVGQSCGEGCWFEAFAYDALGREFPLCGFGWASSDASVATVLPWWPGSGDADVRSGGSDGETAITASCGDLTASSHVHLYPDHTFFGYVPFPQEALTRSCPQYSYQDGCWYTVTTTTVPRFWLSFGPWGLSGEYGGDYDWTLSYSPTGGNEGRDCRTPPPTSGTTTIPTSTCGIGGLQDFWAGEPFECYFGAGSGSVTFEGVNGRSAIAGTYVKPQFACDGTPIEPLRIPVVLP